VREIGNNWRAELASEIDRTRTELGEAFDASAAARRRAAADMYISLPCARTTFPAADTKMIVDTLKTRAEKLGPLKAASMRQEGEVCSICLEHMNAGDEAISLPACHHIFHWACLSPWLAKKGGDADCPLCKHSIIPELTQREQKWAVAVVERQLARDRERDRALLRQQQRQLERDAHGVLRVLNDSHGVGPPAPTQARSPRQAPTAGAHDAESSGAQDAESSGAQWRPGADPERGQVRIARAVASRQRNRPTATTLTQNLAQISRRVHAGLLDLDVNVAGSLDIDWDSSSAAGIGASYPSCCDKAHTLLSFFLADLPTRGIFELTLQQN